MNPDPEEWRSLRGEDLERKVMSSAWYAREDDLIGGWCVMPVDLPPSSGFFCVGDFLAENMARHVAELHNEWLAGGKS